MCFKKVSWLFQLRMMGISSSFKGVSRVSERSLNGVLGNFQWCFRKLQRSFKEVSRLDGISSSFMVVSRVFEGSLNDVLGKFQWCFRKFKKSAYA